MKIERMTEIETPNIQIGDRLRVRRYTATCQKITDDGAVFLLDQYLDRAMAVDRQNTNKGGYDGSKLRRALQSEDILKEFEDIREYMRPWSNGDLLRVPFAGEMFGDNAPQWIEPDDCEQWPLMKDAHNLRGVKARRSRMGMARKHSPRHLDGFLRCRLPRPCELLERLDRPRGPAGFPNRIIGRARPAPWKVKT
jgi:hypothetical protein